MPVKIPVKKDKKQKLPIKKEESRQIRKVIYLRYRSVKMTTKEPTKKRVGTCPLTSCGSFFIF